MNSTTLPRLMTLAVLIALLPIFATAQNIKVQPYLQDANPDGIFILWETDSQEESIVEWGLTVALGNETMGIAYPSVGDARIHEVELEGLERFTKYYYRVKTGAAVSEIYQFKTPPFASDHEPFKIVAMSDMQRDNSQPDKFREIVEDGVMEYMEAEFGGELIDNLAMVLIPGDLVTNGNNFIEWETTFFQPSEKLFSQVPVYPVLGNHENNTAYYFSYFKLPENGTAGFEEHWWRKDYGNVRIIGLNSNGAYAGAEQLTWLEDALASTCDEADIDFVFAELHHPHKSELWTPGESSFTGEVISRLEQFSTDCGKPSIHFFGHTHGYSRGQSRDHKHLWINVATAGGAIDNWGEFPNFDYDEFSVSQDDYGFVMIEITDDVDPKLVIKRISRGDQDVIVDNQLTDSLILRLNPSIVTTPTAVSPIGEELAPECVTLVAEAFQSNNNDATHGQSHWQVSTLQSGFNNPVFESWKNFENWYNEIDTQAEDDLWDETVMGLEAFTEYFWRVRYRDKEFNWSEWSTPVTFSTGASIGLPNLLANGGAENDLENWQSVEGVVEALTSGTCDGVAPNEGVQYFAVGGLCEHSEVGRAIQDVDVEAYADSIDTGDFKANFGGYLSNYGGQDLPEMRLVFYDVDGLVLGESASISTLNNSWTLLSDWADIPINTRNILVELKGTRNAGTDNDSYFDDLFLKLGSANVGCDDMPSFVQKLSYVANLKASPNPMSESTFIPLAVQDLSSVVVNMVDMSGHKVRVKYLVDEKGILIERKGLAVGVYNIWVRNGKSLLGRCRIIVGN